MVCMLWWIFLRLMLLNEWILNILLINVIKRVEENITCWSWLKKTRLSELSFSFKTLFHLSWRNKKFKYLMNRKLQNLVVVESNRYIPSAPRPKIQTILVNRTGQRQTVFWICLCKDTGYKHKVQQNPTPIQISKKLSADFLGNQWLLWQCEVQKGANCCGKCTTKCSHSIVLNFKLFYYCYWWLFQSISSNSEIVIHAFSLSGSSWPVTWSWRKLQDAHKYLLSWLGVLSNSICLRGDTLAESIV